MFQPRTAVDAMNSELGLMLLLLMMVVVVMLMLITVLITIISIITIIIIIIIRSAFKHPTISCQPLTSPLPCLK